MSRVIVLGSINNDVVVSTTRHPRPGETLAGSSLKYFPGGKGANQAVAASRAGAPTIMIGCVGDDAAGRSLVNFLSDCGVGVAGVSVVPELPTGTAFITVAQGDNTIVVVPGANAAVDRAMASTIVAQHGDVVIAQFETPADATLVAFRRARTLEAITVLNPAPAASVDPELLSLTDYLIVNEHELSVLFSVDVASVLQATRLPAPIHDRFKGTLVVTLGAGGAILLSAESHVRINGRAVSPVDSTGAGDCFVGFFAAQVLTGAPIREVLERANDAAAISVTRWGAAASIPTLSEVLAYDFGRL